MTPKRLPEPKVARDQAAGVPEVTYRIFQSSVLGAAERRFESEAYLTGGYSVRLQIQESGGDYDVMDRVARVWQPGRLKGITVAPDHGLPFLTATQTFDIRPAPRKWLAPSRTEDLQRRFVEPGWILVTCSGNVGDVIVSGAPQQGVLVSHDLLRVQVSDPGALGYVYCFLRSKYGRAMLRSSQYGSIIKHLEPEHLQKMPIPRVESALRSRLQNEILKVFALRDQAFSDIKAAEQVFAEGIDEQAGGPPPEDGYIVPSAELWAPGRRLDAFHYNPIAEQALHSLERSCKPIARLRALTARIFGVARFKHVYTKSGTPYLDSEDIFKVNPEITKFIPPGAKKDASKYLVKSGWLLMACSGQIYGLNGGVVLADSWHEGKILSNHVLRIIPDPEKARAGYLQMALSHPRFGRPLVTRLAFGTEVPEIAPDDVSNFPVIRLGQSEDKIADLVEGASRLRMRADDIENRAVAAIEEYLEQTMRLQLHAGEGQEEAESSAS